MERKAHLNFTNQTLNGLLLGFWMHFDKRRLWKLIQRSYRHTGVIFLVWLSHTRITWIGSVGLVQSKVIYQLLKMCGCAAIRLSEEWFCVDLVGMSWNLIAAKLKSESLYPTGLCVKPSYLIGCNKGVNFQNYRFNIFSSIFNTEIVIKVILGKSVNQNLARIQKSSMTQIL